MTFDFWKGDLRRSEYVRIISTTEDDTALFLQRVMCGFVGFVDNSTEVGHGFHITLFDTFIHLICCCLNKWAVAESDESRDIILGKL